MKEKHTILLILVPVMILLLCFYGSSVSFAAEEGGQVETDAAILFYQDSSVTKQKQPPIDSAKKNQTKKMLGRLPNTGELVKFSFLFSGLIIILVVLSQWFLKRKRNEGGLSK